MNVKKNVVKGTQLMKLIIDRAGYLFTNSVFKINKQAKTLKKNSINIYVSVLMETSYLTDDVVS